MHCELALCHHQMMRLVVAALHHDAHKAQCFEFNQRLRFARHDRELDAVRQLVALCIPADLAQLAYVCRHHAFDCFQCATLASNCNLDAVIEYALGGDRVQRNFIHIDEMLTQRTDIDL